MNRRRRGSTRRRTVALALIGLLAASACTGTDPVVDETTGRPVPGGTLRIGIRELGSLDPQRAVDPASLLLARSRYRGLFTLGPGGATTDALVEEVVVSDHARRYEFTIRADARFSDGSPITAADVAATYNRLVARGTASPYASLLDVVEGYDAVRSGDARTLTGVTVLGERKLRITMTAAFSLLPTHLAHPALGILPPAARNGRFGPGSAASGPFRLRAVQEGASATLVRNPRNARATPHLEAIELTVVSDGARALRSGSVDAAYVSTNDPAHLAPRWGLLSLGIDPQRVADLRARQMIASAIDREQIANTSEEPWLPLERPVPMDLGEERAAPHAPIDIDWGRPGPLRFIHLDDAASRAFAAGIVRSCRANGITIQPEALGAGAYAAALESETFDLVQLGWLSEVASPDGFLGRQLGSKSIDNQLGFGHLGFDKLIAQARGAEDRTRRNALYAQAEAIAMRAAVLIPVVQLGVGFDASDAVHGADLDGSGTFDAATAWLEPDVV